MNRLFCFVVAMAALPRKVTNRLLSLLASAAASHRIVINWADTRIINPSNIRFKGSFQAGRGLWLQAIGPASLIEIGDGAKFSDWIHIGAVGRVSIGRNALIGSKVLIIDHSHGQGYRRDPGELHIAPADRPLASRGHIVIGDNVWLGDNVIVLSGSTIGDNCVIGANAVVRGKLPCNSVCAGDPARVISDHSVKASAGPVVGHGVP